MAKKKEKPGITVLKVYHQDNSVILALGDGVIARLSVDEAVELSQSILTEAGKIDEP